MCLDIPHLIMAGNKIKLSYKKIKLPLETSIQSKLNDLCEFVTRKNSI